LKNDSRIGVCGLVLMRQQPGTASGIIFMTIEDETGIANLVIWPKIFERHRQIVLGSSLVGVFGRVQRDESGKVIHVIAERMVDLTDRLYSLALPGEEKAAPIAAPHHSRWDHGLPGSRDFH
jgi:error-prone DNA polymerase